MTILVAYAPRPEGQAALDKGLEIAKRRGERLVVVNAGPGGNKEDTSVALGYDAERIEKLLAESGIEAEFKQFVRGGPSQMGTPGGATASGNALPPVSPAPPSSQPMPPTLENQPGQSGQILTPQ